MKNKKIRCPSFEWTKVIDTHQFHLDDQPNYYERLVWLP